MNIVQKSWLGVVAALLISTATFAQTAPLKLKKTAEAPAPVESTQKILDSEPGLIVLQLQQPMPQNSFVIAASNCPNGSRWLPNYICTAWNSAGTCTHWEYAGHSCQ